MFENLLSYKHLQFLMEKEQCSEGGPTVQRAEFLAMENHSQSLEQRSNQNYGNLCLAGFQNYCRLATLEHLSLPSFLNRKVYRSYLIYVQPLYIGRVKGRTLVSSLQVFISRRTVLKELYLKNHKQEALSGSGLDDEVLDLISRLNVIKDENLGEN